VVSHSASLEQVSVGNQSLVWTRDSGGAVHQLVGGQLQAWPQVGAAAHLSASNDGTLWTCNGSEAQTFRLASDLGVAPSAIAAPGAVQKVTGTGFGFAHCLATAENGAPQVYKYQSPYTFRTPGGGYVMAATGQTQHGAEPIEQGLGSLFFEVMSPPPAPPGNYQMVALDAHTGQELSRSAVAPAGLRYTAPVFDPIHQTLVVGLTAAPGAGSQPGRVLGLDARDLSQVRWSLDLPNNLPLGPGRPTLQATRLCVSDGVGSLVMYDTGVAASVTTPNYLWTYSLPLGPDDDHNLPPPVVSNGQVYAAWWVYSRAYGFLALWLATVDVATGSGSMTGVDAAPGYRYMTRPANWDLMAQFPPVLAALPGTQAGDFRQVLFVNGGTSVGGIDIGAHTVQYYDLPAGGTTEITSGFGYANGVLWFGDNVANLYGVDGQLKAVPNTPTKLGTDANASIDTSPVPYADSQG
jgi:hypothetical protein